MLKNHPYHDVGDALYSDDFDLAQELCHESLVIEEIDELYKGKEGILEEFTKWSGALSELAKDDYNITQYGDLVFMEGTLTGKHTKGDLKVRDRVLKPLGNSLEFKYVTVAASKDGQLIRVTHYYDQYGIIKQLEK